MGQFLGPANCPTGFRLYAGTRSGCVPNSIGADSADAYLATSIQAPTTTVASTAPTTSLATPGVSTGPSFFTSTAPPSGISNSFISSIGGGTGEVLGGVANAALEQVRGPKPAPTFFESITVGEIILGVGVLVGGLVAVKLIMNKRSAAPLV